jgi:hypothetical protein
LEGQGERRFLLSLPFYSFSPTFLLDGRKKKRKKKKGEKVFYEKKNKLSVGTKT